MSLWLAVISNCNPLFNLRKACLQKDMTTAYKMAEENVPAPTKTDEQLVPVKARLHIGKSNLLMDLQKMQKESNISSLSGHPTEHQLLHFQPDELWFTLDADLLCSALEITPKDSTHPFVAPPFGDLVIDFVNARVTFQLV
uniref:Uncharacterized protein n=1 Tax=Tanacetum cinerariifolium TaxID=118510 RepID=A0A6L2LD83_TANCI|nr:hypothetical protein [Tanacetum cinerariifolium]